MKFVALALCSGFALSFAGSLQAAPMPPCLANGSPLAQNDAQVETWEDTTANQFLSRGHIAGKIVAIYPDHNGHKHFGVQIGASAEDAIEVIYNLSFGALPPLAVGMDVEACGDYITSTAPSGPYPASPDQAILHWVHGSHSHHPAGYVAIQGVVYGQGAGNGGGAPLDGSVD